MKEDQMDLFLALMSAAGVLNSTSFKIKQAHDLIIDIANSETKKIHDRFTPEELARYEELQRRIKADQLASVEKGDV